VGRAPGNRCLYREPDGEKRGGLTGKFIAATGDAGGSIESQKHINGCCLKTEITGDIM